LHRPPPPLTEEEINLLLNNHVATPAYIGLQHSHSLEHVSETSSITENENLSLNHDNHGALEEVSKPIYDDDFQPEDHLVDTVLFHEEDRVVMFNNLEKCLLFEDTLDYDLEECGSEIDSFMIDIPSICLTDDTPDLSDDLFMMNIQKNKKRRFIFLHTRKFTTVLLCLMNVVKVFLKMMNNNKLWFNRKEINNIMKEISLCMTATKKIFGQQVKDIRRGY
jgi:hypothetical protein